MYEGICHGGPLNGRTIIVRRPKGFLLVDRPADQCWIYEWRDDRFEVRDEQPAPVYVEGPVNRYRAAEEGNYDVVAAPWAGGSQ